MARWEHFEHGADIGVRGVGASAAEAFEQAALGLTAVITSLDVVEPREAIDVSREAPDLETLFVDWLNALVFEMAARRMLFSRFEVHLDGLRLNARAWGEPVDVDRHVPAVEVKGATYTALAVTEVAGQWTAQCVVDV
jgi:tRNA nucleotidyltransferase (CCA-adding enzyme)